MDSPRSTKEAAMRNQIRTVAWMAVVLASAGDAFAQPKQAAPASKPQDAAQKVPATAAEALDDINKTFGFVPQFIKAMPDSMIAGFWFTMKSFQANPNTSLDGKTKELIGLAVASQI